MRETDGMKKCCSICQTHTQKQSLIFALGAAGHLYWSKCVIVGMTTPDCESRPQIYLRCKLAKIHLHLYFCLLSYLSEVILATWLWSSVYCRDDRPRLWGTTRDQSQMRQLLPLRIQSLLFCDQGVGMEIKPSWQKWTSKRWGKSCGCLRQTNLKQSSIPPLFWPFPLLGKKLTKLYILKGKTGTKTYTSRGKQALREPRFLGSSWTAKSNCMGVKNCWSVSVSV